MNIIFVLDAYDKDLLSRMDEFRAILSTLSKIKFSIIKF